MVIPRLRATIQKVKETKQIAARPFRVTTCDKDPNELVNAAFKNIGTAWNEIRRDSPCLTEHPEYQIVITLAQQAIESLCLKVQALYEVFQAGEPTRDESGQLTEGNLRAYRADAAYLTAKARATEALRAYETAKDNIEAFRVPPLSTPKRRGRRPRANLLSTMLPKLRGKHSSLG